MRTGFLFLLLLAFTSPAPATERDCAFHYAAIADGTGREAELLLARQALDKDLQDIPAALRALTLDPAGIDVKEKLGDGFSGVVYRVRHQGRDYALKLFYPLVFDPRELQAVPIQHRLGQVGAAPAVKGVVQGDEMEKFFRLNQAALAGFSLKVGGYPRFGLVMDFMPGTPFKRDRGSLLMVSPAERAQLEREATQIAEALHRLDVRPEDLDMIVTEDRSLRLIDLTFYRRGETKVAPMTRQLRNMLGGIIEPAP